MTNVVMPQMGESIAEGTIVRWMKKVGDQVDRDEPLFEISTDKVDAEIPSPAAGVLTSITVKEGETVAVNSVVAVIGGASDAAPPAEEKEERAKKKKMSKSRTIRMRPHRRMSCGVRNRRHCPPHRERAQRRHSFDHMERGSTGG